MEEMLSLLRARIRGETDDLVLSACLADAESMCLGYMGRKELPKGCQSAVLRLAVSLYNRQGIEGQSSHSEGGVSITADPMPEEIKTMLRPLRLAQTG